MLSGPERKVPSLTINGEPLLNHQRGTPPRNYRHSEKKLGLQAFRLHEINRARCVFWRIMDSDA